MTISRKIEKIIADSSFIRKMFEEGARLKTQFGAENVYDFSLGNPNVPPPERFNELLRETVNTCGLGDHCYMPNTGYPMVCGSVAEYLAKEQQAPVTEKDVLMTCGASGALNVTLKAVLDPGDEVLTPIPCFVEYKFYADNHGGVLKTVQTTPVFELDLEAIAGAITDKTKVIYAETMGNPQINVLDIEAVAKIAHDAGVPLVIDNTFASPVLCQPIKFGADIVVHDLGELLP